MGDAIGTSDNLDQLQARIQADPRLARLESLVRERMRGDPAHDFSHVQRVALWTIRLGRGEFSEAAAVAAAFLHDWVNLPKDSPDRARASELSAEQARSILGGSEGGLGFAEPELTDICLAIRTHSYSRGEKPVSALGRCLQDADRLEALGALGVFRTLVTGVKMGASLVDWNDPWAEGRALDDRAFSVDHFFTKLLRLSTGFQTEAGREEAEKRAEFLWRFLEALAHECGWSSPPVLVLPAEEKDDRELGELLVDAFVSLYARKMPEVVVGEERKADLRDVASKRASGASRVLVAWSVKSGRPAIAGTVTIFRPEASRRAWRPGQSELRYMAVARDFRAAGISDALLKESGRLAREWGARAICLHVRRGASGVAGVYRRYGYERRPEGDADLLPEIFLEAYELRL